MSVLDRFRQALEQLRADAEEIRRRRQAARDQTPQDSYYHFDVRAEADSASGAQTTWADQQSVPKPLESRPAPVRCKAWLGSYASTDHTTTWRL